MVAVLNQLWREISDSFLRWSSGVVLSHMHHPCSYWESATGKLLQLFRISSSFYFDL